MTKTLATAIRNVLRAKRSERLELQQKYSAGCRDKGGPQKGLSADIERLRREIKTLEESLEVLHG